MVLAHDRIEALHAECQADKGRDEALAALGEKTGIENISDMFKVFVAEVVARLSGRYGANPTNRLSWYTQEREQREVT